VSDEIDVRRIGGERVRIVGCAPGAPVTAELVAWLRVRGEVVEHAHREDLAVIDVRFQDPPGRKGAFVRALRDRVFTLVRPGVPPRLVEIAHAIEGRVRLRLSGFADDDQVRLAAFLQKRPGVTRASASPASQSILVLFAPGDTTADDLLAAARASCPEDWPAAAPEPSRPEWRAMAFNSAVLAMTVSGTAPEAAVAAAVALTAVPSARRAFRALAERRTSVDLLDLAAIGISLGTGQPLTAAFITWLLGAGDIILSQTTDRARAAISKLM
jgi:Cu2+-exporting ATPase